MRLSYSKSVLLVKPSALFNRKRIKASFVQHKAIEPFECNDKNKINYFAHFLT